LARAVVAGEERCEGGFEELARGRIVVGRHRFRRGAGRAPFADRAEIGAFVSVSSEVPSGFARNALQERNSAGSAAATASSRQPSS